MSAIILRLIVFAAIAAFVYFGVKRLLADVKNYFRGAPPSPVRPDLRQAPPPEVIDLKRGSDGVYRPPTDRDRR
jgi:hypothetical protein